MAIERGQPDQPVETVEAPKRPEDIVRHLSETVRKRLESCESVYVFDDLITQYKKLGLDIILPGNLDELRKRALRQHIDILYERLDAIPEFVQNEASRYQRGSLGDEIDSLEEELAGRGTEDLEEDSTGRWGGKDE